MKTLFAALLLSTLAAPVLALDLPMFAGGGVTTGDLLFPSVDEFGRRSGICPPRGGARVVAREGSPCGGV